MMIEKLKSKAALRLTTNKAEKCRNMHNMSAVLCFKFGSVVALPLKTKAALRWSTKFTNHTNKTATNMGAAVASRWFCLSQKSLRSGGLLTLTFAAMFATLSGCATPEKDPFDAYPKAAPTTKTSAPVIAKPAPAPAAPLDIKAAEGNGLAITPIASNTLDIHPAEPTTLDIVPILPSWEVNKGSSLKTTLAAWCKQAGCDDISWELPVTEDTDDFKFSNHSTYPGSFAKAVQSLANDMKEFMPFKPLYYTENRILRIIPLNAGAVHEN